MRTTHTFVELEVSDAAYLEIYELLAQARYHHAFIDGAIDMHGIALTRRPTEDQADVRLSREMDLDLGDDHALAWTSWKPDRDLNPQYADLPDVERIGAIVRHKRPDGEYCWSGVYFDGPVAQRVFASHSIWKVESWDPLTLSPSLLCRLCGDHGFIREGRWVRA